MRRALRLARRAKGTTSPNPAVGAVEEVDDTHCVLVTGADSIETVAVYIGLLDLDFHVTEPPELVARLRALADRYTRATTGP